MVPFGPIFKLIKKITDDLWTHWRKGLSVCLNQPEEIMILQQGYS